MSSADVEVVSFWVEHGQSVIAVTAALLGALIGSVGGVAATMYAQHRQSKRAKFKEIRDMLFAAMSELVHIFSWADKVKMLHTVESLDDLRAQHNLLGTPPTEKLRVITGLYFPQFHAQSAALSRVAVMYLGSTRAAIMAAKQGEKDEASAKSTASVGYFKVLTESRLTLEKAMQGLMTDFLDEKPEDAESVRRALDEISKRAQPKNHDPD